MPKSNVLVGIDVGTTKVGTIVAEIAEGAPLNVLGLGLSPSRGVQKGVITDLEAVTESVASSLDKAERLSGYKIGSALVSIAGGHVACQQSKGSVDVPEGAEIGPAEMHRALDAARSIELPGQREVLHVIPRQYVVDGNPGVKDPRGMTGFHLELDAHVVTAHVGAVNNVLKVLDRVGLEADELVLQPLASAQAVLTEAERDLGVVLVDVGGGTTDVAVFIEDAIWHTAVLPLGGNNVTNDLAIVLGIPVEVAERLKVEVADVTPVPEYANAGPPDAGESVTVETFGGERKTVSRDLVHQVVDSRLAEIFSMVQTEIRRSGYDDMIPAGVVLTGGTARMRGLAERASKLLGEPVRLGVPSGMTGLSEAVSSPAFATAVGLPLWRARSLGSPSKLRRVPSGRRGTPLRVFDWFREFLP